MNDATRALVARVMASVGLLAGVVGVVWMVALGLTASLWVEWVVHNFVVALGSGLIVWAVAPGQPRNAEIWVFAWAGLFTGLLCFTFAVGAHVAGLGAGDLILEQAPADLPIAAAVSFMFANFLWVGVFFPLTLGLALFPDGRVPSTRWRWLIGVLVLVFTLLCLGLFWAARPSTTVTLGEVQDTNGSPVVAVLYLAVFALVPFCVAALVVKFRRSVGVERQQFRWMVWGAAVTGVLIISSVILDEALGRLDLALVTGLLSMAVLMASIGIAIAKYRIYDIDVVISRTFVYGSLALSIGVLYVGIVAGLGSLLGILDPEGEDTFVNVIAVILIPMMLQPLRRRLERVANRIVYGRRATPYEVLSGFSQRMSGLDPAILTQVAHSLAEGTTASAAAIWMQGSSEPVASWPDGLLQTLADSGETAEIRHDGELLGHVGLSIPPGQPFTPADRRLLDQVAAGLGLAVRNLQLTENLRARVEEVRDSRRRIAAVQDQTRRQLERDLHDGAQQRLVALKIKLGIGSSMAARNGLDDLQALIEKIKAETDQTIESVRDFARGIYPPLLEAEGLGVALTAQAARMPIPVTVRSTDLGRYPKEQEATVYFCVLEALQNAMKYSEARLVEVTLSEVDDEIRFQVRDDGVGFDDASGRGSGLVNMVDRVEALGGRVSVRSTPGGGTSVSGGLPVPVGVGG